MPVVSRLNAAMRRFCWLPSDPRRGACVVVTALVQAVLGGVGLAISGVPYATLLTVVMILSCLVQLGPLPVLIPAIIWLYWTGDTTGHRAAGLERRRRHSG